MLRAVLYLRLSESDDASTAISRQEADLRARCQREGWDVTAVLIDDGLSGGKRRVKADRALSMLLEHEADVLIVWKFDRWSRQGLASLADLLGVLDKRPAALFISDRDNLSSADTATWEMQVGMLATLAKMERKNMQMRVASSIARLRRDGRYSGGTVPYGYRPDVNPTGPGRVLVVDDVEAAIVHEAARRILDGASVYSVTTDLNAREIPTRRGATWSIQALRQILTADAIVGRVKHHGEIVRDDEGIPMKVWPPVLDVEIWHRVRAHLGADLPKGDPKPQRRRRARLLSGVVTCALCNAPLYVKTNGAGNAAYACTQRSNGRPCPGVSISADRLEEYVTEEFLRKVGDADVMERVEEAPEDGGRADVERALRETAAAMADDDADVLALSARLVSLKAHRAELRDKPTNRVVRLVATGETFAEAWESGDEASHREMLAAHVAILTVSKGQRGQHGLDDSRVTLISQPAFAGAPSDYRPGRVVV